MREAGSESWIYWVLQLLFVSSKERLHVTELYTYLEQLLASIRYPSRKTCIKHVRKKDKNHCRKRQQSLNEAEFEDNL